VVQKEDVARMGDPGSQFPVSGSQARVLKALERRSI